MPDPRRLVSRPQGSWFAELGVQARLVLRLISDRRVAPLLKLLPIGSLLYLLFPFDFLGPVDDALIIWLGGTLFIELCPPDVVEEHRAVLESVRNASKESEIQIDEGDIIDAQYETREDR